MARMNIPSAVDEFLGLHRSSLLADADPMSVQNLVDTVSETPDELMSAASGVPTRGWSREAARSVLSSVVAEDVASWGSPYATQEFDRETSLRNGEFLSAVALANGLAVDEVDEARRACAAGHTSAYDSMLAEYFSR